MKDWQPPMETIDQIIRQTATAIVGVLDLPPSKVEGLVLIMGAMLAKIDAQREALQQPAAPLPAESPR